MAHIYAVFDEKGKLIGSSITDTDYCGWLFHLERNPTHMIVRLADDGTMTHDKIKAKAWKKAAKPDHTYVHEDGSIHSFPVYE